MATTVFSLQAYAWHMDQIHGWTCTCEFYTLICACSAKRPRSLALCFTLFLGLHTCIVCWNSKESGKTTHLLHSKKRLDLSVTSDHRMVHTGLLIETRSLPLSLGQYIAKCKWQRFWPDWAFAQSCFSLGCSLVQQNSAIKATQNWDQVWLIQMICFFLIYIQY